LTFCIYLLWFEIISWEGLLQKPLTW
jgi:hypothetical protein